MNKKGIDDQSDRPPNTQGRFWQNAETLFDFRFLIDFGRFGSVRKVLNGNGLFHDFLHGLKDH